MTTITPRTIRITSTAGEQETAVVGPYRDEIITALGRIHPAEEVADEDPDTGEQTTYGDLAYELADAICSGDDRRVDDLSHPLAVDVEDEPEVTDRDIRHYAERLASRNGWEHLVSVSGRQGADPQAWVQFAAPLHDGRCPDCQTQQVGPHWTWIDAERVAGGVGGQCGGCGQYGTGWVVSEAATVESGDDVDWRGDEFVGEVGRARRALRRRVRRRLTAALTRFLGGAGPALAHAAWQLDGQTAADALDLLMLDVGMPVAPVVDGAGICPAQGVITDRTDLAACEWVAWAPLAWDPEGVTVSSRDLAEETS